VDNPAVAVILDLPQPEDATDHSVRAGYKVPHDLIARYFGGAMAGKLEQEHA